MEAAFQSGFASALLDVLFNRVTDVIVGELKHFKMFDEALQSLETTILKARKQLEEVDTSQCLGKIKILMQNRVDCLTILCYETDDLMDDVALKINKLKGKKHKLFNILKNPSNWTMPKRINMLQQKLDHILLELEKYEELVDRPKSARELLNGCTDLNLETPLVGRAEDIKAVIKELYSCPPKGGVSIVGMHGLGKTTLVEAILKEKEIKEQFLPLYVLVSEGSFNLEEIYVKLGGLLDEQNKDERQKNQHKALLIIIDNLLDLSIFVWMSFCSSIRSEKIGGSGKGDMDIKFLITTLDPKIPKLTGTIAYYLKRLSDDDCQAVITENALLHKSNLSRSSLSCIARSIAMKCEGLPLVAKILGFAIARDNEDKWFNMDLRYFPVFANDILPVLRSNYLYVQNKKLLTYFSLFPLDYYFNIDDLVHLWIGEGFIQPLDGTSSLEQTGNNHINDLLGKSILQATDDLTRIGKPRYKLHKSSHEFAESIASKICQRLDKGVSTSSFLDDKTRHLSLVCCNIESWDVVMKLEGLRTILSLNDRNNGLMGHFPHNFFKKLRHLRVLALNGTDVTELPESIERLIYLRYLDISNTPIKHLPETLPKLHNLQFIKFKDAVNLLHLPEDFQNLTNLLFLDWDISDVKRLNLPCNIGKLSSLQNLPLFPVGDKDGYFITELRNMNCLQGSICITNLQNVKEKKEAEAAMLHRKTSLKRIELEWMTSEKNIVAQDVLEGLKPHDHLKELKITNYGSTTFPGWISHPLPMIEKMHLQGCRVCNVLPSLGQLPNLKTLVIEEMSGVEHVNRNFYELPTTHIIECFPSLESLEFKGLAQLQDWTNMEANDMPHLRALKIVNCPALIILPSLHHLSSLVHLQIERCQKLRSLPELPNSIESLIIRESDKLKARCQNGDADWLKVDRVPNVEIDYTEIQTLGVSASIPTPPYQQQ